MGIEAERFVYSVPPDSFCILCGLVLQDPVEIIKCGHYVCNLCWEHWKEKQANLIQSCHNEEQNYTSCPYCGLDVKLNEVRKSKITWNLIQNYNVYCLKKPEGCGSIYKLGFEDLHKEKCCYYKKNSMEVLPEEQIRKCETCNLALSNSTQSHSCIRELQETFQKQKTELANLEHENNRLIFKLATCEKEFMEERTEIEGQFLQESLKYNKEIRDLRTRYVCLQGELSKKQGKSEVETISIDVERVNGSLGFNIIGGVSQEDKLSSGIYVSRIVEGGAADRPGKLLLHDCVLEVDGVNLRNATHDLAVQTFRNSGDPVKMVVQRTLNKHKACDAMTQTFGVAFAVTGGEDEKMLYRKNIRTFKNSKSRWLTPDEIGDEAAILSGSDVETDIIQNTDPTKDEQKSEQYDSAYDTLLTQKSSRSTRSPSLNDPSDADSCSTLKTTSPDSSDTQGVVFRKKVMTEDNEVKRNSTFIVIPNSDDNSNRIGKTWEDIQSGTEDADYEYEYEEVNLEKNGGKFGMELCYGGDEKDVAVYVGDLEENSVADISGKIMVGDQIVQINGTHVNNVEQAYKMLQEYESITLVVARAIYDIQSEYYDEAEETDLDMLDCINEEQESIFSKDSSATYISSESSKSSKSPSNSPKLNKKTYNSILTSPIMTRRGRTNSSADSKSDKESIKSSLKNFVNKFTLSDKKQLRNSSHSDDSCEPNKIPRCDSNSSTNSNPSKNSSSGKENEQRALSPQDQLKAKLKEQRNQSKMKAYLDSPSLQRHRVQNNMIINRPPVTFMNPNMQVCPMMNVPIFTPTNIHQTGVQNFQPVMFRHTSGVTYNPGTINHPLNIRNSMTSSVSSLRSAMKNSRMQEHTAPKQKKHVQIDPHQGWNETERRVWEEFKIIQSMESKGTGVKKEQTNNIDPAKVEAEWRVRRSKDGKHIYIKKTNSARNKTLKERTQQINDQRCGMTTDDDAFTVYQGQYWDRDQRKKQLVRHNDRRKRLMEKAAFKAAIENKTEKAIAEMVQRKMTLPGTVFDNFITVEEILSQRNRSGIFEGPVHVTTI